MAPSALSDALKNPAVVLTAGPRPVDARNAFKKASPLMQLGAGLMLGMACLMPVQSFAAVQAQPTAVEHVIEQNQPPATLNAAERTLANAPAEVGRSFSTSEWIENGKIVYTDMQGFVEQARERHAQRDAEEAARAERAAERAQYEAARPQREAAALKQEIEQGPRKESYGFQLKKDEYEVKRFFVGDNLKEASERDIADFAQVLVSDAYKEIRDGGTENPSQRLMDICKQVQDLSAVTGPSAKLPQSDTVFKACNSDEMQSATSWNTAKEMAAKGSITLGFYTLKALALGAAFLGVMGVAGGFKRRRESATEVASAPTHSAPKL